MSARNRLWESFKEKLLLVGMALIITVGFPFITEFAGRNPAEVPGVLLLSDQQNLLCKCHGFFAIKLGLCSLRKLAAIGLHFARDINLNDNACHNVILWGLRSQKCLRFTAFLKARQHDRQHDTRRSAVYYQVNKKLAVLNRITSTKSKHVL